MRHTDSVLNSVSEQARAVLCHLACLPSRGVNVPLLVHLTNLKEDLIRTVLDECASLGIVTVWSERVTFVHDKPHAATLALIDPRDKPMLLVKIGRRLEGYSADYGFAQADMLLGAWESDPTLLDPFEVARASKSKNRCALLRLLIPMHSTSCTCCSASCNQRSVGSSCLVP